MKSKMIFVLCLFCFINVQAQFENDIYTCDEETYDLLCKLSDSQLGKGKIYLFTTTHQDLAWLNHIDACIADRDTLWLTPFINRLETDPTFRMDIEQTSIVMEYIHRHPEAKAKFDKYIKEGRICVGGAFVQAYEEMYAGESLTRQFYLGARWLKKNFDGYKTSSYFNVDVPGRTLQMPQIMAKAGINNLVMSRQQRGLFYWKAPDGSKVRAYTPGHYIYFYNVMAKPDTAAVKALAKEAILWYTEYNDVKNAETVMPAMLNFELSWDQKPVHNTPIFINKWNKVKYIRKLGDKKFRKVNLPKFMFATADNFFSALDFSTKVIPEKHGERPNVWLYIHGPSHEKSITACRKGDMLLPAAEKFATCRAMLNSTFEDYPASVLNAAWKAKIYPDHGMGGNCGEMTDNEFRRKFEFALAESEKVINSETSYLASCVKTDKTKGKPVIMFNHLSYDRSVPIHYSVVLNKGYAKDLSISDSQGNKLPIQLTDVCYYDDNTIEKAIVNFVAPEIPSMGYRTFYLNPNQKTQTLEFASDKIIENQFYKIDLVNGGIKQIYDKDLDVNLLRTDKFLGGEVITMHSKGNGAGEFDAVQQPDMENFDKTSLHAGAWTMLENGPVFASYKLRTPIRHAIVEQILTVYHNVKRIDMEVNLVNWEGVMFRDFRLMWPLAFKNSQVTYEVPFGALNVGIDEMAGAAGERYYEENKNQHPRGISNWISASGDKAALTLSSSVAVADYIDPTDNPVDYTILQPILMASRKSCHYLGNDYFQPGDHSFEFSLTSHAPESIERENQGVSGNAPLIIIQNPVQYANASLPENYSFVSLNNSQVKITAMKKCEDDNSIIIRMYNCSDKDQKVNLKMAVKPKKIIRTTLIEEEQEEVHDIILSKFAIETFKIKF